METLIIGKPAVNTYLPLQEFPKEGDLFYIKSKNESVGNVGATAACLLAKWGMSVHFTGVVGNDSYAEKIRDTLKSFRIDTKYLETQFKDGTATNYIILNNKTGISSKILFNNPEIELTKYKYDFIPDWAIIDGTDRAGAYALLNNNGTVKTVYYGSVGDKDSIALSKRCTWVVCTQLFAEMLTKTSCDGTAEGYVELYQKIVDSVGKGNYIVILNNHKILYTENGQVKMLPEMKMNVADYSSFDAVFVGAFTFAIQNGVDIDKSIKLAEMAAALSLTKIGETTALPEIDEVLDNSGLRDKILKNNNQTQESPQPTTVEQNIIGTSNNNIDYQNSVASNEQAISPINYQNNVSNNANIYNNEAPIQQETNMFDMPQQVTQTPVQQETNMFDNPNV